MAGYAFFGSMYAYIDRLKVQLAEMRFSISVMFKLFPLFSTRNMEFIRYFGLCVCLSSYQWDWQFMQIYKGKKKVDDVNWYWWFD